MTMAFESYNAAATGAVVLTVTHAGRDYPAWAQDRLALSMDRVRPLEDRYADVLVDMAITGGHRALIARTPRLVIDLNRAETDFEARAVSGARNPASRPSHRARGGLGLVPERLGNVQLWRSRVSTADLAERVVATHRPWHTAVESALAEVALREGRAVLLDIHSMPTLTGTYPAQIVIGNRYGASADVLTTETAVELFRQTGLRVAVNVPYAGAYMLDRHAQPSRGISALQIEIDRALYLDSALDRPGHGVGMIQNLIAQLADVLDTSNRTASWPLAAE